MVPIIFFILISIYSFCMTYTLQGKLLTFLGVIGLWCVLNLLSMFINTCAISHYGLKFTFVAVKCCLAQMFFCNLSSYSVFFCNFPCKSFYTTWIQLYIACYIWRLLLLLSLLTWMEMPHKLLHYQWQLICVRPSKNFPTKLARH